MFLMRILSVNEFDTKRVMTPERVWTISNILSILRGAMGFPIALLLSRGEMIFATVLIVLAIISDALDGFIARKTNQVTNLGKALDPIADKMCILTVLLFLIIEGKIPIQFLIFIGIRDLAIAIMSVYLMNVKDMIVGAVFTGKISIIFITATMLTFIYNLYSLQKPLVYITYIVLIISFIHYLIIFLKNFSEKS
jgi:CDP-diacylglycerol--glycerol-3-phosphate 3-phosphatidyltransferase